MPISTPQYKQYKPHNRMLAYPTETPITIFASGHGFSVNSSCVEADNTSVYIKGSQSAKVTTKGDAVAGTFKKTGMGPYNLTGKYPKVWLRIEDMSLLQECSLYVSSDNLVSNFWVFDVGAVGSSQAYRFLRNQEWVAITLDFGEATQTGTPDISAINAFQFRFRDTGTGVPANIYLNGISFLSSPTSGVVSLCFDDSYASQFTLAKAKMDQYGFPGTAYTIVNNLNTFSGFLTTNQLYQMQQFSGWEVAAHHETDLTSLPINQLDYTLCEIRDFLIENGFTSGSDNFAYPNGAFNDNVLAYVRRYFRSGRTIITGPSNTTPYMESIPPADPYKLRAYVVSSSTSTTAINTLVTRALNNKAWLMLIFHNISSTVSQSTDYSTTNFNTVIDNINTSGIAVRTVNDVLNGVQTF